VFYRTFLKGWGFGLCILIFSFFTHTVSSPDPGSEGGAARTYGDRLLPIEGEVTGPPTLITSELSSPVLLLSSL
jgi:hypothetical protein